MTVVLLALTAAVLGLALGLRLQQRRFLVERQRRREAEAKVDMYNLNALATDHDVIGGPITGQAKVVELFDGARLAEWREEAEAEPTGPPAQVARLYRPGADRVIPLNDWADAVHGEDDP